MIFHQICDFFQRFESHYDENSDHKDDYRGFPFNQLDGFVEQLFLFNFASSLKKLKLNINWDNTQIGTKCDFRDRPRITFEAVADAMFAQFH